jgi:hypothetical protein
MTLVEQEAPATNTGALSSKTSLEVCTKNTSAMVLAFNALLDDLTANDLDALASLIHDRAARQRVEIDFDVGLALVEAAWVSPMAERSEFRSIIQVKACLRRLISRGTYHPEQVRSVFTIIAYNRSTHPLIACAAVDLAISEGLAERAARAAEAAPAAAAAANVAAEPKAEALANE